MDTKNDGSIDGKRMRIDVAVELAEKLNAEETDGWTYEALTLDNSLMQVLQGVAVVMVRDEEGVELGPLGQSSSPDLYIKDAMFPGGWASISLREDGDVGVLTASGYFDEKMEAMPKQIQNQLKIRSKKIEEIELNGKE